MNTELLKLLDAIAGLKVIVIGEAMLDCYLAGKSDRLSPEAPAPVLTVTQRQQAPGGAANTAVNIHTLGGCVTFLSVIGDDWEGKMLRQVLEENRISTKHILTRPGRQTLSKQRLIAASELLMRFDMGSTEPIDLETEQGLIGQLTSSFADCDALIVADYGYGILTPVVIAAIARLQHASPKVLVVDSKNLSAYRSLNVTAVKPNYNQAIKLLGIMPSPSRAEQILAHREQLLELTGAGIVAVTLDAQGAIVFERNRTRQHRTASQAASPSGTSGAGDTYVSALTVALAAKASVANASHLAAAAAAIVVAKDGTTPCSVQELREFLCGEHTLMEGAGGEREAGKQKENLSVCAFAPDTLLNGGNRGTQVSSSLRDQNLKSKIQNSLATNEKYLPNLSDLSACTAFYRAAGGRIVFTNGCFDILHAGHVSYLNRARALGDVLIIGVNSDTSVSRLKGSTRPINPLLDRIQVLAALSCVDRLISFEDDTPIDLIRLIRPDIYVKGGDYTKQTLPEAIVVEELGGIVEILPFVENRSTTSLINRICQLNRE